MAAFNLPLRLRKTSGSCVKWLGYKEINAARMLFSVSFLCSETAGLQKCIGYVKKIHEMNAKRMACFLLLDSPPEDYSIHE
jgi:hypothetical protein